jgi:hypothetical protein
MCELYEGNIKLIDQLEEPMAQHQGGGRINSRGIYGQSRDGCDDGKSTYEII